MLKISYCLILPVLATLISVSCSKEPASVHGMITLKETRVGRTILEPGGNNPAVPADSAIYVTFNTPLDKSTLSQSFLLKNRDGSAVACLLSTFNKDQSVRLVPARPLEKETFYRLEINALLKGSGGEGFQGAAYDFKTSGQNMVIASITVNGQNFLNTMPLRNIDFKNLSIVIAFSEPLNPLTYQASFSIIPGFQAIYSLSDQNRKLTITNAAPLSYYRYYTFRISNQLTSEGGNPFSGFSNSFYTGLDSIPKFPVIPDDELLMLIQRQTFRYFYDLAHPVSGMARERNSSGDIVTTGGSGFGVMALIVGMESGFITRQEGIAQLQKIVGFLETCDRFHGAWPHWLNGSTGKAVAFTQKDDGADLVETSYMVEGLYTMRQYLDSSSPEEKDLIERIDILTDGVDYAFFTRGQNVLYWHWSPNYGWDMNMQIRGYNEALITYIVAGTSTTHGISADVYHDGYARNGAIRNGNSYFGITLPLGEPYGGPLFFTHYSYLGLDPRNLNDRYASYWQQNVNQSLINQAYCANNPRNWVSYGESNWGLTASDDPEGYDAHSPTNDNGTISPTAAVSAIAFTPEQSLKAIRYFYYMVGDRLWGEYGFYDAFNVTKSWWADSFLAIDQGPVICMIENYRSQLLWNLFMSHPKVGPGLTKLGFSYRK